MPALYNGFVAENEGIRGDFIKKIKIALFSVFHFFPYGYVNNIKRKISSGNFVFYKTLLQHLMPVKL